MSSHIRAVEEPLKVPVADRWRAYRRYPRGVEIPAIAASIVRSLGIDVARTSALPGGNENHVVRVNGDGRDLVVRFSKVSDQVADPFDVEALCLRAAATAGIPSSPMVARGWLDGLSFLVVDYVAGNTPSASDPGAWRSIGRFASSLAKLDVSDAPEALFSRFGRDLDVARLAHLDYNREALSHGDALVPRRLPPRRALTPPPHAGLASTTIASARTHPRRHVNAESPRGRAIHPHRLARRRPGPMWSRGVGSPTRKPRRLCVS
ncbi:hypothetical protein IWX78_003281 [Mycetocola sp. CAN_C7]|uniref:phosphotransferase n=1 Tax=Mycetocola sp. CAN_C7 TaxID=2787724 RepID=UPI0018C9492C